MIKYRSWLACVLGCALIAAPASWALVIGISNTQELSFGRFVAASGGSVVLSPGGARSATGAVELIASGPGTPAQYVVSGDPNLTYAISLPADGTVALTSGANTMPVNSFTSSPGLTGTLGGGGTQALAVGATLSVGSAQAGGTYSGSFDVTVIYN